MTLNMKRQEEIRQEIKELGGTVVFSKEKGIVYINLIGSNATDKIFESIQELTKLRDLCLSNTKVTDAGIEKLATLTNLRDLYLPNTKVTDAGVEKLSTLTNLELLVLANTKVTNAKVEKLQKFLPNCRISCGRNKQ